MHRNFDSSSESPMWTSNQLSSQMLSKNIRIKHYIVWRLLTEWEQKSGLKLLLWLLIVIAIDAGKITLLPLSSQCSIEHCVHVRVPFTLITIRSAAC